MKMKTETMDIAYIALELTRIYMDNRAKLTNGILNRETVSEAYNYYMKDLLGVEDIVNYAQVVEELEETKQAYNILRDELKNKATIMSQSKLEQIKEILEQSKGDMEPYVYESLIKLVK